MRIKKSITQLIIAFCIMATSLAQDDAERRYLYPVFPDGPGHGMYPGQKPKVEGWAKERVVERFNRGIIAQQSQTGEVYVGWRLLETDAANLAFNLYRAIENDDPVRLNNKPLMVTTDFVDTQPVPGRQSAYWVRPVLNGREQEASEKALVEVISGNSPLHYRSIKLQGDYMPGRSGIAVYDLNGDGHLDFVIKQPNYSIDPAGRPNTDGTTYKIEAYLSDGTFLWRKDLGPGIEPGIWYSPYVVYDFNGNGRGEVAVKTAPGVERDANGRVMSGGEKVTILDGMTGQEIASAPWPERNVRYGDYNRTSRNQMGVAYLDGKTPCLLLARGTYKLMVLDAYQLKDGQLERLWRWDGDEQNPVIRSQGAHTMISADIDGDGRDEIILGSVVIDDNGLAMWSAGFGHPDRMYLSDIDPSRPGMEILYGIEDWHIEDPYNGVALVDARTGKTIWNIGHATYHISSVMAADIEPSVPGLEIMAWEDPKGGTAGASSDSYMLSADGQYLARNHGVPGRAESRHWIFWDNGLLRQMVNTEWTGSGFESHITMFNGPVVATGIEGDVRFTADIFGDWREEIITVLPGEIRIYTTTIQAKDRRVTLLQDPVYRSTVTHNSMGYYQSPMTGYYLGVKPDEKADWPDSKVEMKP